jgi:hypothetical protein
MQRLFSHTRQFIFYACLIFGFSPLLAEAEMIQTAEKDTLSQISTAIEKIEDRIKNHRLFITPSKMDWPEMTKFENEIMYVLAHDPNGPPSKLTPPQLHPSFLSERLRETLSKLEMSVYEIGGLEKDPNWLGLKADMELFFQHRKNFMYQSARIMVRSLEFKQRLENLKIFAYKSMSSEVGSKRDVTIKVMDPYIEKMSKELELLNQSILQLKEFRTPRVVPKSTIFQSKNQHEIALVAISSLVCGILLTALVFGIKSKFKKIPPEVQVKADPDSFNYYDWVKNLETYLQQIKNREDHYREDLIRFREMMDELKESRTNQENILSILLKMQDYIHKESAKRSVEVSRKLIEHISKLCEVIEAKKEMNFSSDRPKLKLVKSSSSNQKVA